jgi:hypothetical protein
MKEVLLKIPERKYKFFMELIQNLDFVQVNEVKIDSKEEIVANLTQAFKELKLIKEGKLKGIPAKKLLDEL